MKNILAALLMAFFAGDAFGLEIEMPTAARQGGIFKIVIKDPQGAVGSYKVNFLKKDFTAFLQDATTHIAVIPVDVWTLPGKHSIGIYHYYGDSELHRGSIEIKKFKFPEQKTIINQLAPSVKENSRRALERKKLDSIYTQDSFLRYFDDGVTFKMPVADHISAPSPFGIVRWYKYPKQKPVKTHHYGIDYPAIIGTAVLAAESGEVRFVEDLLYEGKTIILDHGYGLFSIYAHLSKVLVKEGDVVTKGSNIALSGNTGRVRGKHGGANLHFGINIKGVWVDPKLFLGGGK